MKIDINEQEEIASKSVEQLDYKIRIYTIIAWGIVAIGGLTPLFLFFSSSNKPEGLSGLGDFIGGITATLWSLAGLLFVFTAFLGQQKQMILQGLEILFNREELKNNREELRGQKEQMIKQNANIDKQNFETTFFNLLSLHRMNVAEWEFIDRTHGTATYNDTNYKSHIAITKSLIPILEAYKKQRDLSPSMDFKEISRESLKNNLVYENYHRTIEKILLYIWESQQENKKFYEEVFAAQLTDNEYIYNLFYFSAWDNSNLAAWFNRKSKVSIGDLLKKYIKEP